MRIGNSTSRACIRGELDSDDQGTQLSCGIALYGIGFEFFDQTWKPDEVVKVQ
ncbi:hypothetical protein [Bradyrhizobium sp. McL0616]|uniref:hypothetical protein n=1 Tax=Bradyrhizobium sp. McL0616 TaxID=3415674 RepID=UPI003CEB53B6